MQINLYGICQLNYLAFIPYFSENNIKNMKIAALVLTIVFALLSIAELTFCYLGNDKARKALKVFCVLDLGIIINLLIPEHPLVYCALYFGALGDLLLIFKKNIYFYSGAVSFLVGHLLFISELLVNLIGEFLPYYFYIILPISILLTGLLLIKPLSFVTKNKMAIGGGCIYFNILLHSLALMITTVCFLPTTFMYFGILGYVLFITSDFILCFAKFKKDFKGRQFIVMLTYLLAEAFLSLAFFLTLGL